MPQYANIRTAQNVEINYKLAGLGSRIIAKILDYIILIGYLLFVTYILTSLDILGFFAFAFYLPAMLYSLLFEIYNDGQTPGKSILKCKVISLDGSPLTVGQSLMRWLMLIVDIHIFTGLVGIISIAASRAQQRLGDLAAGTIVIDLKNENHLSKTAFTPVENTYSPIYTEATLLSEKDIRIIQKVLSERSPSRYTLVSQAAQKIQDIVGVRFTGSPERFLRTLVKDYNYFQNEINNNENLDY